MTHEKPEKSAPDVGFKIINWIGIIEQLSSTKARQALADTNVPMPQFVLLNHFSHKPDEGKTVSHIAWAMQQPQPGITKTIAKMLGKGFLRAQPHPQDRRSKILFLTETGHQAHALAGRRLVSAMSPVFDGWTEQDKHTLFSYLDRLKIVFDENR